MSAKFHIVYLMKLRFISDSREVTNFFDKRKAPN